MITIGQMVENYERTYLSYSVFAICLDIIIFKTSLSHSNCVWSDMAGGGSEEWGGSGYGICENNFVATSECILRGLFPYLGVFSPVAVSGVCQRVSQVYL